MKFEFEIGRVKRGYIWKYSLPIKIEIELAHDTHGHLRLSISGTIGSRRFVYSLAGQILDELRDLRNRDGLQLSIDETDFQQLLDIWDEWHLNDVRPYCQHQKPIAKHAYKLGYWEYEELLKIPQLKCCPVCGYEYGTAWHYEPLPQEVIDFIHQLYMKYGEVYD